jgi:hypothetical protein
MPRHRANSEDESFAVSRQDVRQARRTAENRDSRETEERRDDRLVEQKVLDASARQLLRAAILPTPPDLPGFHSIWLSTTNAQDPIYNRMRLGYRPVKFEEFPDYDATLNLKTGDYAGCVGCNEMVLFKIPMDRYQAIMTELHHDAPNEEDGRLSAATEAIEEQIRALGGKVERGQGDGWRRSSTQGRRAPVFQG